MIEASIAFIVIFSSFLNDPLFYVRGISAQGTFPQQGCMHNFLQNNSVKLAWEEQNASDRMRAMIAR